LPRPEDIAAIAGEQEMLHELARDSRRLHFGNNAFVRGVVEISNFCRENCHYCGMRRENRSLKRSRASVDELADLLIHHRPSVITDINIQAGEDAVAARDIALPLVRMLRMETRLGISVSLGTLDRELYEDLRTAGASVYIMKFEVANSRRYSELQAPGNLAERLDHIRWLAGSGWNVSSGFIVGLPGDTAADWAQCCRLAAELPLRGCSVSPFIPGEATPLANAQPGNVDAALNCISVLRLVSPHWVIPAVSAFNLDPRGSGYLRSLNAGANLVTINLTPADIREDYLIYRRDRVIMDEERVRAALDAAGLVPSQQGLVEFWNGRESVKAAA
jgi:biotin synthase